MCLLHLLLYRRILYHCAITGKHIVTICILNIINNKVNICFPSLVHVVITLDFEFVLFFFSVLIFLFLIERQHKVGSRTKELYPRIERCSFRVD